MTDLRRDLNATIAHIVGQGAIASAMGCEIKLAVDLHPSGEFFEGNCWVRNPAGELSEHLRRPLGLAGCLSSLAFLRGSPSEVEAAEVFDKLKSGEIALSPADAEMAEGFSLADVEFALNVLRANWQTVAGEVEQMSPEIMPDVNRFH